MKDLLREAKRAARRGDLSRAGDLCDLAGHPLEAIAYYVEGKHFFLAAQVAERIGEYAQAAVYFGNAGNHSQAAEMYLVAGQKKKASMMFGQSGQYLRAAALEEQMTNYSAAATFYEMAGQIEKAAYLFARVGEHARAARLYEDLMKPEVSQVYDTGAHDFTRPAERTAKYARFAGILYFKAGQFTKAAPYLEEAGLIDQAVIAYRKSGRTDRAAELLMKIENYAEALQLVEDAPAGDLDPKLMGELYLRSGRYEEAARVFLAEGLNFRAAECFESAGDQEKAAELFFAEGEVTRAADLYAAAGKHLEAARAYKRANELDHAGREFERAGQQDDAARMYLEADRPIDAARIFLQVGRQDEAIRALQQVTPAERHYGEASLLLGTLFFDQGLYAPAATKLETAQKLAKGDLRTKCLYHLALTYEQLGRARDARKLYEQILAVDFHHADVAARLKALSDSGPVATEGPERRAAAPPPAPPPSASAAPPALPSASPPAPARVALAVSGRLEVVGVLGAGRHGSVIEAYDRVLQRKVAAKRYPPPQSGMPDIYHRFLREAKKISELNHPNLVNIHGVGEDSQGRYIIEEIVQGRTLREIFDERIRFEPARVIDYATQICEMLAYVHRQGVLHRNLRPENVFILPDDQVKVSDFGLGARITDPSTAEGRVVCYLSPEVIRSEKIDLRSDLYSFGIILYEMLLGEPPFPADTATFDHLNVPPPFPSKPDRPLPRFLRRILDKCLEKDRGRRYRCAEQILDELKASALVPGAVIAERYEIVRELGIGGMGRIYQALDRDLDETVALKVLRTGDAEARHEERFVSEIKMTRRITHPNVVKVFDLGTWKELKYITMEFIDGVNLEQWVRLRSRVDIPVAVRLVSDIAAGLTSAHALGIIHRDIKPQNILIKDGTIPKILDFGIARAAEDGHMTTAGFVMGSPKYMSPEQIQAQPLDARSDIYSLGVVMYFLFTGREPFVGETPSVIAYKHVGEPPRAPRDINPEIPSWLNDLILKTLAKNREDRFPTAESLMQALRAGLSDRHAAAQREA